MQEKTTKWIGNANPFAETTDDCSFVSTGHLDGFIDFQSFERFENIQDLSIPWNIEETITCKDSSLLHTFQKSHAEKSPLALPYEKTEEHSYARASSNSPPDDESKEMDKNRFLFNSNDGSNALLASDEGGDDNLLPIIDDLFENPQNYNFNQLEEALQITSNEQSPTLSTNKHIGSAVSSPNNLQHLDDFNQINNTLSFPNKNSEAFFQPLNEYESSETNTNFQKDPINEHHLVNMITQFIADQSNFLMPNNVMPLSNFSEMAGKNMITPKDTELDLLSSIISPMLHSPSNDSGIYSSDSSTPSPYNQAILSDTDTKGLNLLDGVSSSISNPEKQNKYNVIADNPDDEFDFILESVMPTVSKSKNQEVLQHKDSTSSERNALTSLFLSNEFSTEGSSNDEVIDFNLLDDSQIYSSDNSNRNSVCEHEELNHILDGTPHGLPAPTQHQLNSNHSSTDSNEEPQACKPVLKRKRGAATANKLLHPSQESNEASEDSSNDEQFCKRKTLGQKKYKSKEAKERKMSQNRTASHRYRRKKKEELHDMEAEANELEGKNKVLRNKVEDMRREMEYLKALMMDVIKARFSVQSDLEREETLMMLDELTQSEMA